MVGKFLAFRNFCVFPDNIGSYEITLENDLPETYTYNGTFVGNTTGDTVIIPAPVVRPQLSLKIARFFFHLQQSSNSTSTGTFNIGTSPHVNGAGATYTSTLNYLTVTANIT